LRSVDLIGAVVSRISTIFILVVPSPLTPRSVPSSQS
jgi:hypothetical protein